MRSRFKGLSVVLTAVLAMTSVPAAGAQAAEFHSEIENTTFTGGQMPNHVLTTNAGTVTCTEAEFSGNQAAKTVGTVQVTPAYNECTAFGFLSYAVDEKSCTYTFNATGSPLHGGVTIDCSGSDKITMSVFGCTVTVGPQTADTVSYINTGSGSSRTVDVKAEITGLTYTQSGFLCGGSGTFSNGTYTGDTEMTATSGGVAVGIWVG
jgi:hypothetical protein